MTVALTQSPNAGGNSCDASFPLGVQVGGDVKVAGSMDATTVKIDGTAIGAALATGVVANGIPLSDFRAPAAWKDALGDSASTGILGLADTPGSVLKGVASNGDSQNDKAVVVFRLPHSYVPGSTITVRIRAKKDTTAGTVSDSVDLVAKLIGDTLGSDICTTAAQAITTSYANYDFTVTPTGLVQGDLLALEVAGISDDTGGTTNKAVWISRVEVRLGNA